MFAYGKFNGKKGGHLVLHEPKLIIELLPGDIFLFPSGCFAHQNTPIGPSEARQSLTAYAAGGLFRFHDQGFQTKAEQEAEDPDAVREHERLGEQRWRDGCNLYSTLDELFKHWDPDYVP